MPRHARQDEHLLDTRAPHMRAARRSTLGMEIILFERRGGGQGGGQWRAQRKLACDRATLSWQKLEVYEAYQRFTQLFDGEFSDFMQKNGCASMDEIFERLQAEDKADDRVRERGEGRDGEGRNVSECVYDGR